MSSPSSDSGASAATATPSKGAGRPVACKRCNTFITSSDYLVSRAYRGYRGKAALYSAVSSETTDTGPETVQLMQTGAYTVCSLTCAVCNAYIGWEFVRAHEESEAWKAGHAILESTCVQDQTSRDSLDDELRGSEPGSLEDELPMVPRHTSRYRHISHSANAVWRKTFVKLNVTASLRAGGQQKASRTAPKWQIDV